MKRLMILPGLWIAATSLLLAACGDDGTQPTPDAAVPAPDALPVDAGTAPGTYAFESRFVPGESSVSYSGQTFRQVLIAELAAYVEGLTGRIDTGAFLPAAGEVSAALGFYYEFDDSTSAEVPLTITTEPALLQMRYADISSGKDLKGKLAGNDPVGQHKDWSTEFRGWSEGKVSSPDALVQYWMGRLDELAVARASGSIGTDPTGQPITKVYITESGQDLKQLLQKFLLGAVSVSQAMDDYLDDATPGAGLHSSNARDGDAPYSVLEHGWDEGFGYFGAARDYNDYSDDELAGAGGRPEYAGGYHDSNGDGAVDLLGEYNFGSSTNAGKRDRGSAASAPTDFSKAIFDGFLAGRAIISAAGDELGDQEMSALIAQRDIIIEGWDKVIAATVIHYINEVLKDMSTFASPDYSFADHAKHWSELKGFALGMQFNPYSKLDDAQFVELHTGLGDAPVLPGAAAAEIEAYRQGLLGARDVIARAYGFDPANVGDESGMGGW